jgi:hypothetical protein
MAEQRAADRGGEVAVDGEVVPFEQIADGACSHHPSVSSSHRQAPVRSGDCRRRESSYPACLPATSPDDGKTLTLSGVDPSVVMFTDRPARAAEQSRPPRL